MEENLLVSSPSRAPQGALTYHYHFILLSDRRGACYVHSTRFALVSFTYTRFTPLPFASLTASPTRGFGSAVPFTEPSLRSGSVWGPLIEWIMWVKWGGRSFPRAHSRFTYVGHRSGYKVITIIDLEAAKDERMTRIWCPTPCPHSSHPLLFPASLTLRGAKWVWGGRRGGIEAKEPEWRETNPPVAWGHEAHLAHSFRNNLYYKSFHSLMSEATLGSARYVVSAHWHAVMNG